jgi:hypothetical protein
MYTPKISEELVPVLYRLAKERSIPMTRLVDGIIRRALTSNSLPQGKLVNCQPAVSFSECEPRKAVA